MEGNIPKPGAKKEKAKDTEQPLVDMPEYWTETMKKERSGEIKPLPAFDDEEWLEMAEKGNWAWPGSLLTPKEFVGALKTFGFQSFDDYYSLDKKSKYELLKSLGVFEGLDRVGLKGSPRNRPLEGTVRGYVFSLLQNPMTEKLMDKLYDQSIRLYNAPKEKIDTLKSSQLYSAKMSEAIQGIQEHGETVVKDQILEEIPDIREMSEDEKIDFFEKISNKEESLDSLFDLKGKKKEEIKLIIESMGSIGVDIGSLRSKIKEEILKWDRGEFDLVERDMQQKLDVLYKSLDWGLVLELRTSAINLFVQQVKEELINIAEVDRLLKDVEESWGASSDARSFSSSEMPEEVKKKEAELIQKYASFYGKISDEYRDKLPGWLLRKKAKKDFVEFIKSMNIEIKKRVEII
jgi:hypothetical protein